MVLSCSYTLADLTVCTVRVLPSHLVQVSKKYVSKEISQQMREKAKPFIDWLEQASEEEEDDEDAAEEEVGLNLV